MIRTYKLLLIAVVLSTLGSCVKDPEQIDKYSRPDWLSGKLFTQIQDRPELSIFAQCLEISGYDTIINTSGSYTVFAPDNDAFAKYFIDHPQFTTVTDIPVEELTRFVKYHIVQNPWSFDQLKKLDVYGWIDTTDINNDEPRGFKRETLLREKDQKYGVMYDETEYIVIVDTLLSPWYRRQATDSRKHAPIFYSELFNIYDLDFTDFTYYFGRNFDNPQDIYFVNGKILTADIFAENGFVHVIDRVVEPLKNAYQILSTEKEGISYSKFLNLVNMFPEFTYNEQKTIDQPGADLGYDVDSLFDIKYPELAFNISNERTKAPSGTLGLPSEVTIRYHHGMIAPTNEAFDNFMNQYISGDNHWGSFEETPIHLKRMIANTHMSVNAIYPSDFDKGFYNGEKDIVRFDPSHMVQKEYGSNCTFIGTNEMIVPRALKSITGPIYLERKYSTVMYAIEKSGLLPALKKESNNYSLYVESDINLSSDSSLYYDPFREEFSVYQITGDQVQSFSLTLNDLRALLLNHIGSDLPKGIANKEFIRNLAGNYIIYNNSTGEVSGTAPTTIGYKGSEPTNVFPLQISENADNGVTYDIKNWFNFSSPTLYGKLSVSYVKFHNLLKKAGLANDKLYEYNFLSPNEFYTVFIPSDAALDAYQVDTMGVPGLKKFLQLHFIQGDIIFTDGNKTPKYYESTRIDEKSTTYTTYFTKYFIEPGIDVIYIKDASGANYVTIPESSTTNIITGLDLGSGQETIPKVISTSVVHQIDKVLVKSELDTE